MDIYEIQKANPEIFPRFQMKDTLFLYYNCPQKEKILQLYSKHIQLNLTVSGKRILRHGSKSDLATKKKGFLLKRCAYLQELPPDYSGWDVIVFYLKDDYLKHIFNEFRPYLSLNNLPKVSSDVALGFEIDEQIRNCYKGFLPYFQSQRPLPEDILENKFKELLFMIFSHPNNKHILSFISKIADEYSTPIWEVMETNYMYNLTLKEFAEIANRSLSTFKRDFSGHYNTTPGKWLTQQRLELAQLKIRTTDNAIREIAFDCGFENPSHFSRVFKKFCGISPAIFRETHKVGQ